MGGMYDALVVPAILHMNPGISLEKLLERLNATRVNDRFVLHRPTYILGAYAYQGIPDSTYDVAHRGIYGLAFLMCFDRSFPMKSPKRDYLRLSGLEIIPDFIGDLRREERLEVIPKFYGEWKEPRYRVVKSLRPNIGVETIHRRFPIDRKIKRGSIVSLNIDSERGFVLDINGTQREAAVEKRRQYRVENIQPVEEKNKWGFYKSDVVLREIFPVYEVFEFENITALIREFPEFKPSKVFNLRQNRGRFFWNPFSQEGYPRWYQEGGKFYLDTRFLLANNMQHTYSSIVLTAEAIRTESWGFLEFCSGGLRGFKEVEFFVKHPDSRAVYLRELGNFWSARHAMLNGVTNSEFLRHSLLNPATPDYEFDRAELLKEYEEWLEHFKNSMSVVFEDDSPF